MKIEDKIYWVGVTTAIVIYILGVSSGVAQNESQPPNQPLSQLLSLLENSFLAGFLLGGVGGFLTLSAAYFPHFKSSAGGMSDLRKKPFSHKCLFVFCGAITGTVTVFIAKKLYLSFLAGVSWPAVVTGYQGLSGVVIKAGQLYIEAKSNEMKEKKRDTLVEADSNDDDKDKDKDKDEEAENNDTDT